MARSRRRTPIASICHTVKRNTGLDTIMLPSLRAVSDEWGMAKDGRSWFGRYIPELMWK